MTPKPRAKVKRVKVRKSTHRIGQVSKRVKRPRKPSPLFAVGEGGLNLAFGVAKISSGKLLFLGKELSLSFAKDFRDYLTHAIAYLEWKEKQE